MKQVILDNGYLLQEVPEGENGYEVVGNSLIVLPAESDMLSINLHTIGWQIISHASSITEEQAKGIVESTKYLIEDFRTNEWLTLGEMFDSSKNMIEQEKSRWTKDANLAIHWNTRQEAENHFKKYHNQIDMGVTEHLFYLGQMGQTALESFESLLRSHEMKKETTIVLQNIKHHAESL